jgi:DNA-directed RNA polymerase subunit RPC12/RpoP
MTDEPEDTHSDEFVICPHCNYRHADAWVWCGEQEQEETCSQCGKDFIHWVVIEVTYHAKAKQEHAEDALGFGQTSDT